MRPVRALLSLLLLATALPIRAQEVPWVRRPVADLIAEARADQPPVLPAARRLPDLVDLATLDPTLRFDIRYATADNFVGAPVYDAPRAFLQRPAAEALVRVNAALRTKGLALRIHDAYRPWWVTKVFWEITAPKDRAYVADPARGSIHNRGGAVDLDLVRLSDGQPLPMPSEYDEMTKRSHPDYAGGPEAPRQNRDLLKAAMAAEGFTVEPEEWWHYDHATARDFPVMNLPLAAIQGPSPLLAQAEQVLLVTTAGWDDARARLQRYERRAGLLVPVGGPLGAWVGKAGLAWRTDEGAPVAPAPGPLKREGDGRAPAGLLTFGELWGYADAAPAGVQLPYRAITDCDRCVDDPDHPAYATLQRLPSATAPEPWRSAERLKLDTEHYRYLVVIHYNDRKPRKGAGSCIFLHVAPPPGGGTAGCTALAVDDLLVLLRWLDPARNPVLVQVPEPALAAARAAWQLPAELGAASH